MGKNNHRVDRQVAASEGETVSDMGMAAREARTAETARAGAVCCMTFSVNDSCNVFVTNHLLKL